jgi:hypothetical protein
MTRLPITLRDGQAAELVLRSQGDGPDVIYVHGSTFGCDLSLFFRIDGVSWADALERASATGRRALIRRVTTRVAAATRRRRSCWR